MRASRVLALAGLVLGVLALGLQAALSFPLRLGGGDNIVGAVLWFFTYYTILTNLMLVLIYLSELTNWRWLEWWRRPWTRGMMAGAIVLVLGFYHVVLAGLWAPEGLFYVADVALHYATPAVYVLWWLAFGRTGLLGLRHVLWMLLPSMIWLAWALLRGALIGEYPYPILEADKLGYPQVALNLAGVLAVLVVLFAIVIALDRWLPRRAG